MRRLACLTAVLAWQVTPTIARATSAATHYDTAAECPSTTLNYITQSLPQQCLRTDWSRSPADREASSEDVPSTAATRSVSNISAAPSVYATASHSASGHLSFSPEELERSNAEVRVNSAPSVELIERPPAPGQVATAEDEDSDPLSDHGNFLSFEQWKAQMLERAGQSPDHVIGSAASGDSAGPGRRRQQGIENALESLGDEGEIELDFHGFVGSDNGPAPAPVTVEEKGKKDADSEIEPIEVPSIRSKEAGTTSKERFNYASFDCAATILKTSKGSKGATWILSENKDSYLLNKCSESNKHFIVELCNDIWIDTVVLGNFEFFSSTFRHFKVSISDQYPVKSDKWRELGTFEARNTRGVQAFMVEDGRIWGRYLKVELLTHYGKEYYCPVSLLRVHGKTMMDDFRNEMKGGAEHEAEDDEEATIDGISESTDVEVSAIPPVPAEEKALIEKREAIASVSVSDVISSSKTTTATSSSISPTAGDASSVQSIPTSSDVERQSSSGTDSEIYGSQASEPSTTETTSIDLITPTSSYNVAAPDSAKPAVSGAETGYSPSTKITAEPTDRVQAINMTQPGPLPTTPVIVANISDTQARPKESETADSSTGSLSPGTSIASESKSNVAAPSNHSTSEPAATTQATNNTQAAQAKADVKPNESSSAGSATKSKSTKALSSAKASSSVPATQDSFFRSVHKRLQMLESNSTLSLQYIEEQSRILRDAFGKAEKRQLLKTSNFLESLNNTVLGELRHFRTQYDQIWQSTILELASQREQSQKEVRALGERLGLLADELVWQKRVVYLQFILIILSLGLVIFSKNGVAGGTAAVPLELSLLQSIQHLRRSNNGLSVSFAKHYSSSPDSQPGTPRTPSRPNSMGGFFGRKPGHRRYLSDGITSGEETGIGTEVTNSPDQRRRVGGSGLRVSNEDDDEPRMRHIRTLSDETTLLASGGEMRSKSPSIDLPADQLNRADTENRARVLLNGVRPDVVEPEISRDEDENEIPDIDPMALKRAASSPALGRHGDGTLDDDGSGDTELEPEPEPEMAIKVENSGNNQQHLSVPIPRTARARTLAAPPLSAR